MARKRLLRSNSIPYHVTARANNREPFHCELAEAWRVFSECNFEISILFRARIHAFVMMNNHIHLLVTTPEEDLGKVMDRYIGAVTQTMNRVSGRSGRVFGAKYHWTLVNSDLYFATAFKYVYRNPVRAGICEKVEDYPWSSLAGLSGRAPLPFPIHYAFGLGGFLRIPEEESRMIDWLNTPFPSEIETGIQKALRRREFKPPRMDWKKRPEAFENALAFEPTKG